MTKDETRRLGIEFERRIIEIYPQFSTTEKLSTDTIYSFLSEFLSLYVKTLYLAEDDLERGSRKTKRIHDIIKALTRRANIYSSADNEDNFELPVDYAMYIRSDSVVLKNYKTEKALNKPVITPNVIIKLDDVAAVINSFYNEHNVLPNPMIVLESTAYDSAYLRVLKDAYTTIDYIDLTYCCQPYAFNVIKYNDENLSAGAVHSCCLLPYSCFEELVSGAVDMYITLYKLKLQQGNKTPKQLEVEQ